MKQSFKKADRLFLLIGMDAFAEIANWHQAEALFKECEFIVAGRPGYSLADVANALPESLRPRAEVTKPFHKQAADWRSGAAGRDDPSCWKICINRPRQRQSARRQQLVSAWAASWTPVADYIKKMGLYK